MAKEKFGDRLARIRESRRMSASDLARLLKVTPTAVWNWEKQGVLPRPGVLGSMAEVLGVTEAFLISGDGSPASETVPSILNDAATRVARATGVDVGKVKVSVDIQN